LSPLKSPSGRVSSSVTQETARPRRFTKGKRLTFGSTDDIAFDPQFATAHVTPEYEIPAVSNEADAFMVCAICAENSEDMLLLQCDGCECFYHNLCLVSPLTIVYKGDWNCQRCLSFTSPNQEEGLSSLDLIPVNHVTNEEILQSTAAFTLRDDVILSLVNSTSTNLYELLHLLGHRAFKSPAQQAACVAVTNGGTVSFRTVTGGGKTLAYMLPTLAARVSGRKGLTIVTGPLNFLQRDQYAQTIKLPILSSSQIALIDGDTTASDRATIFDKIHNRELHILFVGTAMLVRNRILHSALLAAEIELLVIIVNIVLT